MRNTFLFPALRAATVGVLCSQMALPVGALAQQTQQQAQQPTQMDPEMGQQMDTSRNVPIERPLAAPLTEDNTALAVGNTTSTAQPLSSDGKILLVLDRFTYGPRPGDLERVRQMGLSAWFHEQLNPQSINDSAMNERLLKYPAMKMPLEKMFAEFPTGNEVRASVKDGKGGGSYGDAAAQAVFKARADEYRDKLANKKDEIYTKKAKGEPAGDDMMMAGNNMAAPAKEPHRVAAEALPLPMDQILAMPPDARYKFILKLDLGQMRDLYREMPVDERGTGALTAGFTPTQMEMMAAFRGPEQVIGTEAVESKLLRDIYSNRQLQEVMVDFWLNHFNVYMKKSEKAPYFIAEYERDVIRPNALGNFTNLLLATAQSPAMLDYLDQEESVGPHSEYAEHLGGGGKKSTSGLNENYAREVMELHTVGVDGGYTQKDVTELAKVFTGWTVSKGYGKGDSERASYDPSKHEPGNKTVLGHTFHDTGVSEGLEALKMLAASPQCAHFVSSKLAVRFMGDKPPAAVVDRMAAKFSETHGDIRQVIAAMVNSPEFFTAATYRTKVKTPQDYVVSAVRAAGSEVENPNSLAKAIADLGMPLYGHQTPDGYSMRSDAWNSTTALVSRMNFAMALASNRVQGVHTDYASLLGSDTGSLTVRQKQDRIEARLLHEPVSARTEQLIYTETNAPASQQEAQLKQVSGLTGGMKFGKGKTKPSSGHANEMAMADPDAMDMQAAMAVGLVLGSPEFQRR